MSTDSTVSGNGYRTYREAIRSTPDVDAPDSQCRSRYFGWTHRWCLSPSGDTLKLLWVLLLSSMCHGYVPRDRSEDEQSAEDSDPAFLNEESNVDTELVTDGGDEE